MKIGVPDCPSVQVSSGFRFSLFIWPEQEEKKRLAGVDPVARHQSFMLKGNCGFQQCPIISNNFRWFPLGRLIARRAPSSSLRAICRRIEHCCRIVHCQEMYIVEELYIGCTNVRLSHVRRILRSHLLFITRAWAALWNVWNPCWSDVTLQWLPKPLLKGWNFT